VAATVSTSVFEGPIEALLQLVNTHQVDIYDVPLAAVVDAFVAEMATWESVDMATASEFLVVAAVLVELKSRRLLPGPDDVEPDEELIGWEERDLLLARLLECQAYAAAADAFTLLAERAARAVPRTAGLYHVTVDTVTVAEAVSELEVRLPLEGRATFRGLTGHLHTRIEVIVRFLALLELCKQGRVALDQGHTFGDLQVEWVGGSGVPVPVGAEYDEYEG